MFQKFFIIIIYFYYFYFFSLFGSLHYLFLNIFSIEFTTMKTESQKIALQFQNMKF